MLDQKSSKSISMYYIGFKKHYIKPLHIIFHQINGYMKIN